MEEEAEEEVEEEAEEEVEEEAEEEAEEALEQHPLNLPIKGTSESKGRCPRSLKETTPKRRNSLKICGATSA